ncbi:MAG: hypothetical protein SF053_20965 [Bacteroidia bacterium]|nr:hypothetical protein [Bacteroidia bacterium]
MYLTRSLLLYWLIWAVSPMVAQPTHRQEDEIVFALEVKQLDEFFERFNQDSTTLLVRFMEEQAPGTRLDRPTLLLSLFNEEKADWNAEHLTRFMTRVTDSLKPVRLHFYDADWYARLRCEVRYHNRTEQVWLTLRIEQVGDAAKWIICGIEAPFLNLPPGRDSLRHLNPISHGTDFLGLHKALRDSLNLPNYLPQTYRPDLLAVFMHEVQTGEIQLVQVSSITYHFLQVEGWIFTVDKFIRPSRNAGWLISDLTPAGAIAKSMYKQDVLHLPE